MKNIFVGNLSVETTEQELHAAFSKYGVVERVNIVTDRDTGRSRGFAFVEMNPSVELKMGPNETNSQPQPADCSQASIATPQTHTVDLDGIVSVTARAIEVLGDREKALRWLRTPLPFLSDRTPLSMLDTADGIEDVEGVLGRIEQGVW
jgi:RNA recognition motif. (a.k.a. RRM, RBD, or RNP domain)/Protein of unknown function (DUF2384)